MRGWSGGITARRCSTARKRGGVWWRRICLVREERLRDEGMFGGASRDRTDDLIVANDALSQLSYSPTDARARGCAALDGTVILAAWKWEVQWSGDACVARCALSW